MQTKTRTRTEALHFDIHGRIRVRVDAKAPAAAQLWSMLACFATDTEGPADIVPAAYTADEASDDIVRFLEELLPAVLDEQA
jgi:hypothetical protein